MCFVSSRRRDRYPFCGVASGCVDGNIVAPESLAGSLKGFHANCVLFCLWHLSRGLWQQSSRLSTNFEVNFLAPSFKAWQVLRRAIKANRITCHYDSEGEYAEPLREARPITQHPIFSVLFLTSDFGHFDRIFATMTEKFERRRSLCPRASEARRVSQDEKRGIRNQLSLNFLGTASSFEVCFTTGSGSGSDTPKNPERLP
jgi:hypothetical protein